MGFGVFISNIFENNSWFILIVKFLCFLLVIGGDFVIGDEEVFFFLGFW